MYPTEASRLTYTGGVSGGAWHYLTAELGYQLSQDIGLFTDASLTGWGCVYRGDRMGGKYPEAAKGLAINELELLAVCIAAKRWGPDWARVDNYDMR